MLMLTRFLRDETGATAIEYGMIAAAMATVILGLWATFGPAVARLYDDVAGAI
ncbi:Flp family type IVb pilin [Maricaulis sp.]|uniref:Flp family type IVb pilin n=1 Tax=Maricaulis sp. TaxID=1486257 RepID=UPI003A950544|tara:strand:- start:1421 stop:1579 length:159 start_codon:yes stop_codon:yes gene_type:complete